ncbi:unnamed protein product [Dovyalis caffra]|uniref:Cyclin-dependent kinase inhibitor domain-containing protein n=1 Tax=Dovyalis caffra TaxID=77055 RepID=A0AAV1R374_9ROSI|nr:unnamed protein product [Dovyalis caffra]
MGKYMRKANTTSDVAVMDLTHGVRTRAKTLALKKQQGMKLHASSASHPSSPAGYLQLRSRRLEKKTPPIPSLHHDSPRRQQQRQAGQNNSKSGPQHRDEEESGTPSPNLKPSSLLVGKDSGSGEEKEGGESKVESREVEENNNSNSKDLGSFGDNVLDIEEQDSYNFIAFGGFLLENAGILPAYLFTGQYTEEASESTRESTPCNLTRGAEETRTPSSTTKPANPTEGSRRLHNSMRRHIPTAREMDEFFGPAEEEQLKQFTEKYNFDPVSEKPLPGRYKWEKLDH